MPPCYTAPLYSEAPAESWGLRAELSLFLSNISLNSERSTFDELREGLTDVAASCCRGLQVIKTIFIGIVLDDFRADLSRFSKVRLVSYEHDSDPGFCVFLKLSEPLLHVLESLGLGEVESNDGSNRPAVVCIGDGSKSFLAGGIPDLVLDALAVDVGGLGGELYSDGGLGVHIEDVVDESREKV